MSPLRSHLTFANVVSLLALFVALGGSSYAAIKLGKGAVKSRNIAASAVTSPKIAANAVTSPKVKDRSLKAQDFALGQLPSGPPGAPGSAVGYALVVKCPTGQCASTGGYKVDSPNSSHVDNDNFDHPAQGIFCFDNNREFLGGAGTKLVSKNVVATVGPSSVAAFAQADSAHVGHANVGPDCGKTLGGYGPNNALIRVYDKAGTPADPDTIFVVFN